MESATVLKKSDSIQYVTPKVFPPLSAEASAPDEAFSLAAASVVLPSAAAVADWVVCGLWLALFEQPNMEKAAKAIVTAAAKRFFIMMIPPCVLLFFLLYSSSRTCGVLPAVCTVFTVIYPT